MTWWMRPGPSRFCAIRKPSPTSPSVFETGNADARVAHLAVRRPAAPAVAHRRDGPDDLDAGRVGRDDDLARAVMRVGVGVGDRHDDPEGGPLGARREPLVAVDDPLVAVAHRARPQRRRIGAGNLRLGHREERAHLARDERLEPALLLLLRAEVPEDLAVPGVRAPGSRRRAAPRPTARSPRSGARTTRKLPLEPPASGGRCGAHRPSSFACARSSRHQRVRVARPRGRARARSGRRAPP